MSTSRLDPLKKGTTGISQFNREPLLQPGDRIGHTRVIELIAAGGMANVYKVWHEQLEVVRAIKILKPGYTEESRGRLETEAKISANLRHPNIVEIYGMGYWNTIPYIEMEFIDGPSLKELLDTHVRLSIPSALAISHYLCVALQFAYNQDMTLYGKVYDRLIHRDIKPANILITSKGVIKLADFGIARPSEVSIHTIGSKVMGTFAYLSPEQLNGEKLDHRSDIYALGTVLYEMISGVKTFPQRLLADLVQKKAKGHYIPLNSMGIQVSKALHDVVEKSLHIDKNKRFSDIGDLDKLILSNLSRISNKPPDVIISKIASEPPADATIPKKKRFSAIFYISILSVLIIAFTSIMIFMTTDHLKSSPSHEEIISQDETFFSTQIPAETLLNEPEKKRPVHRAQVRPEPEKPKPPETFSLSIDTGFAAFNSGNYEEAINLLSSIQLHTLDESMSTKIKLLILDAHFRLGHFDQLQKHLERETIDSPDFYLLQSETYRHFKQFDQATNAIKKALSFQIFPGNSQFRILLLKARLSEELYDLKPNTDNKKSVVDDWNAFMDKCCNGSSNLSACKEAQAKLQQFSN